jgi:transcriptional regulator with XRE-family HTH domain
MHKAAGLTQVQLATRLCIGQSFVSKVERGVTYVELFLFLDWCQACGVVPDTQWLDLGAESGSSHWPPTDG